MLLQVAVTNPLRDFDGLLLIIVVNESTTSNRFARDMLSCVYYPVNEQLIERVLLTDSGSFI